MADLLLVETRQ